MLRDLAASLREEARATNERRLVVLTGETGLTREAAGDVLDAAAIRAEDATLVGPAGTLDCEHLPTARSAELLGTTRQAVVLDLHESCRPNAIGRAVGAVDGGGLLLALAPPLGDWPDRRDGFDETLAVPPFDVDDVTGNFRRRLVETLRAHPGVAIVAAGTENDDSHTEIRKSGLTDPPPRRIPPGPDLPTDPEFPREAYEACLTRDQRTAVGTFEGISDRRGAIVLEADRGRGKSSAAGFAAASLALEGNDVLVTAPAYRNAREVFARAEALLVDLGELAGREPDDEPRRLATETGRLRFESAVDAAALPGDPDVVIVDEAAALPVALLRTFLDAPAVAYATTIHGYEGAGRGFSVRFRTHLADLDRPVEDVRLEEPIRYAAGDPVEVWAFRALALDATPAVDQVVADATPETVTYEALDPGSLLEDEVLLRETFGLLVLAHYRTEPDDLARVLDAPNVSIRALCHDGHVVSVALLAREGDLPADLRAATYEGQRIRGNMVPDVLTSQLRDEAAGRPIGQRVMRIATHHAVRSRGLGSHLLAEIRAEWTDAVDWLGVGYGATPDLLSFWQTSGFRTVHLSTTRNDTSGEHSAIMLDPRSAAGKALLDRHTDWFLRRAPSMLADSLSALDPDVLGAALRAVDATPDLDLTATEWRHAAGVGSGAAIFDTAPRPVRRLSVRHLVDPADESLLTPRQERLLVRKALQAQPWSTVADELDYHTESTCMRAFGSAVDALVGEYGDAVAREERRRFG